MADTNESVLAGGISSSVVDAPILPVQGGGGSVEASSNDNISLLDGGIGEIKVVEGGQQDVEVDDTATSEAQIVQRYNLLDPTQYNEFIKKFIPTTKIESVIKDIERKIVPEKVLNYGSKGDITVLNSKNTTNLVQIKIIPLTTKKLIILPPFDKPEEYINQFMFLIANDYMKINSKKNFIINRNIFIISLAPFKNEPIIKFFYYKLKLSNMTSYYVVGNPFNAFLHPKENGILVSSQGFKLPKPSNKNDLEPNKFDVISNYNIKSMKYKGDSSNTYTLNTITEGEDEPRPVVDYNFTLKEHTAVISLIDEDERIISVDLQGKRYRIRIPFVNNKSDKIYNLWDQGKYTKAEKNLINDLNLKPEDNIPVFLFNLAYFKCFDDVSLLTRAECSSMKNTLQKLYARALHEYNEDSDSDSDEDINRSSGDRVINSIDCSKIDTSSPAKVICKITYNKNENATVELDQTYIDKLDSDRQSVHEAAKKKFLETK